MATAMKRLTIGIDNETEARLDRLKQEKYYNTSWNKMIQDMIVAGLDAVAVQGHANFDEGDMNGIRI